MADDDFRKRFTNFNWSSTPLGAKADWPPNLTLIVNLLLDSQQPMFVAWGERHVFLFNEAFATILGDRCWEALGVSLPELWAGAWEHMGHFFEDAVQGKGALVEDLRLPTWASGYREFRYYSFGYTPIRHGSEVQGVLCVCTDTTAKVTVREQMRRERDALLQAFEQAPGFIAITEGPEHRFSFANAAYRRLVGERELIGKTIAEALPEVVGQGSVELLDAVFATGGAFTGSALPLRLSAADGGEITRFVDIVYAPRLDAEGEVVGLFCEGQDVTERVQSLDQVRKLQTELIHASRGNAMDIMASTLAHELNQPLTAIANYAAAAKRFLAMAAPSDVDVCLEALVANALRAGDIIRGARNMIEKRTGAWEPFSLNRALQQSCHLLGSQAGEVTLELEPHLIVAGDELQIQQVVLNLVRNALESVASVAHPSVKVTASAKAESIVTTVSDNGPGITIEPIEAVFDTFASGKAGGMGLGLAISRTIIESYGGKIWAENGAGGGASVHFELPRVVQGA
jgi:signal transduction histidine kinase